MLTVPADALPNSAIPPEEMTWNSRMTSVAVEGAGEVRGVVVGGQAVHHEASC